MPEVLKSAASRSFDAKEFLATAGKGRTIATYDKNAQIYAQGGDADTIFYIQAGEVKVSVVSEQGREAVIAILGKDEFFGEGCLAGQAKRIGTATSIGDSAVMQISRDTVVRTMKEQPAFSAMLFAHLLARTTRIEADLVDQLFNSSEKRLARALLILANYGKEGQPLSTIANISQETLADMIGTTRSRVSFFMNKFRRLGFISYNGTIEVHNSLLTVVLADQPAVHKTEDKTGE